MASLPEQQRVPIAIVPAGTANLLASNLGIDSDINTAVVVGLHGARKPLDVGVMNGERFAVMAGTGFDALLMGDVDSGRKSKLGRLAYVWSGTKYLRMPRFDARIKVDGKTLDNAIWTYETPFPAMTEISGHLAFYPDKVKIEEVG